MLGDLDQEAGMIQPCGQGRTELEEHREAVRVKAEQKLKGRSSPLRQAGSTQEHYATPGCLRDREVWLSRAYGELCLLL